MVSEPSARGAPTPPVPGACGQAPSNYPEFAEFLVEEGIDTMSLNPDSFIETAQHVAEVEKRQR